MRTIFHCRRFPSVTGGNFIAAIEENNINSAIVIPSGYTDGELHDMIPSHQCSNGATSGGQSIVLLLTIFEIKS